MQTLSDRIENLNPNIRQRALSSLAFKLKTGLIEESEVTPGIIDAVVQDLHDDTCIYIFTRIVQVRYTF